MAAVRGVPSIHEQNAAVLSGMMLDLRGKRLFVAAAYKALGNRLLPTVDAYKVADADAETLERMSTDGTIVSIAVAVLEEAGCVGVMPTMASVMEQLELTKHLCNRFFGHLCNGARMDGHKAARHLDFLTR